MKALDRCSYRTTVCSSSTSYFTELVRCGYFYIPKQTWPISVSHVPFASTKSQGPNTLV
jgi:hypothetical protein